MTPPWALIVAVVLQLLVFAAAWGDLRRTVAKDREATNTWRDDHERQQREQHAENRDAMYELRDGVNEIRDDVKRINGQVTRHNSVIEVHDREINRLRDRAHGRDHGRG